MNKQITALVQTIKDQRLLGGIALDIYTIIARGPAVTVGEVFMAYTELYPTTTRSRNELAKRASDLLNCGAIKRFGVAVCPLTGKTVARYVVTGNLPNKDLAIPVVRGVTNLVRRDVSIVSTTHRQTLTSLASRARFVLTFSRFLPSAFFVETRRTLAALEHAISVLDQSNAA